MEKIKIKSETKDKTLNKITKERKSRTYVLAKESKPPYREIRTRHLERNPLMWIDPESGEAHELRYASNQSSPFVEEQNGRVTRLFLGFVDGVMTVPATNLALQKFLAFHPDNKDNKGGRLFYEHRPEKLAEVDIDDVKQEMNAMVAVDGLSFDDQEAVMWNLVGDAVFKSPSKQLTRDLFIQAKNSPGEVLDLIGSDHAKMKFMARKAIKEGVFTTSTDGKAVFWGKSKTKVCLIPPDKTVNVGIADFFMTDDGLAYLEKVREKLDK